MPTPRQPRPKAPHPDQLLEAARRAVAPAGRAGAPGSTDPARRPEAPAAPAPPPPPCHPLTRSPAQPRPLSLSEFQRLTGYTAGQIARAFPGGWTELRQRAGIPLHPRETRRLTDEDLLADFHRMAIELGRIPRWNDINRIGLTSVMPYRSRFGNKPQLHHRYHAWLTRYDPGSPFLPQIEALLARETKGTGSRSIRSKPRSMESASVPVPFVSQARPTPSSLLDPPSSPPHLPPSPPHRLTPSPVHIYGPRLHLEALTHAPTNEKGVIYAFGILAQSLGFQVESIHSAFPDCEAKRALDPARTRWQRLRIEFEHRSRNFRDHGHNPNACDLIICWHHDWPDCPIEVLELAPLVTAQPSPLTARPEPAGT